MGGVSGIREDPAVLGRRSAPPTPLTVGKFLNPKEAFMAAHSTTSETAQPTPLAKLSIPLTATTSEHLTIRLILQGGKPWVALRDLHAMLGYKRLQTGAVRRIFEAHGHDFYSFTLRLPVGRNAALFINEAGLRLVCELIKPDRTQELRRWLEEGKMQQASGKVADVGNFAKDTAALKVAVDSKCAVDAAFGGSTAQSDTQPNNVVSFAPPQAGKSVDVDRFERRKQYCRELCRVLLRYASEAETRDLTHLLEDVVADQLASRYSPGLNAAAYDVFARYGLKGGAQ